MSVLVMGRMGTPLRLGVCAEWSMQWIGAGVLYESCAELASMFIGRVSGILYK